MGPMGLYSPKFTPHCASNARITNSENIIINLVDLKENLFHVHIIMCLFCFQVKEMFAKIPGCRTMCRDTTNRSSMHSDTNTSVATIASEVDQKP